MSLLVVGINHKTAPLALREKVSFSREHQLVLLDELLKQPEVSEAIVLCTCNRTEIYTNNVPAEAIFDVLIENSTVAQEELANITYTLQDFEAVEHIMTVACGLDSLVLGEQQILGQMKSAVNLAAKRNTIDRYFHNLFQRVFSLAKHVRTTTQVGACPVSVASIAVKLAQQNFPDIETLNVLLLGAGDTIKLVAKYLHNHNIRNITIASRHIKNAKAAAEQINAKGVALTDLPQHLQSADIIMSATASQVPILGKGRIESALKNRSNRPMFLIDMAVPRDIETEVSELPLAHLYTVDDLKGIAQQNLNTRSHAAKQALNIIKEEAVEYMQWRNGLESTDMIRAFRTHIETIRQQEVQQAKKLLQQGISPELVIDQLASRFAKKLMHSPSVQMRQACEYGRKDILQTVQELFAIDVSISETTASEAPN